MAKPTGGCNAIVAEIAIIALYEANKSGVTDKIIDMAMNDSGIRDTGRMLGISIMTVMAYLKNLIHPRSPRSLSTKSATKPA